jgi:hypothetical protein
MLFTTDAHYGAALAENVPFAAHGWDLHYM